MILDTLTYSILTVVLILTFAVIRLAMTDSKPE